MDITSIKQKIESVAKQRGLQLAVLFGSAARGKTDKFSDIDIAIRSEKNISYTEQAQIEYEICKALNRSDVEVINLRDVRSPLLLKFIANEGKALYEASSGIFDVFQMYAMRVYFESKPLLELRAAQLHKHLAQYA